mgnify:FL=1|tara:strand:+ start:223 stop:1314 length:1092 start_codon:yes stop_codon:yes gene_type:complete
MPQKASPKKNNERTKASSQEAIRKAKARILSAHEAPLETAQWVHDIQNGSRKALGQAITLAESRLPRDRDQLEELLDLLQSTSSNPKSWRMGITGVPGVGKSTFIESFGAAWIEMGHRVAVLAVDPSSERSGGSLLGDQTRMEALTKNPMAFIRPSPSSQTLGGVTRATHESILLCEAAGFDRIIVETVGVGQSETSVRQLTDAFILLMLPGAGDDLQGIKRGIMEMADLILVNKCDGPSASQAEHAALQYRQAIHLFPPAQGGHEVLVQTMSALKQTGIMDACGAIQNLMHLWKDNLWMETQRSRQSTRQFNDHVRALLFEQSQISPQHQAAWERLQTQVERQQISAFAAARKWLNTVLSQP